MAALHDSVVAAERGHDDDAVARAWAQLVHLELARGHLPDALLWSRYADALCDRVRACDRWRPNLTAERAMLFSALGRRDDALKEAQRALVFAAKQPEGDHIALDARDKAATVLADADRLDEAIAQERSILADTEHTFGPGHQSTLSSRNNLSAMLAMAHRFDEALPVARSAYELTSAAFGPEVSDTATSLVALGEIEEGLGQLENARQHLTHVAQIYEKNGIGGPNLVDALTHLGRVQQRLGDAGAGATLARAVSAGETAKVGPAELAPTRMALAQALPATERKRAVEQATKARDAFAQAAKSGDAAAAKSRDEADAFLRAH